MNSLIDYLINAYMLRRFVMGFRQLSLMVLAFIMLLLSCDSTSHNMSSDVGYKNNEADWSDSCVREPNQFTGSVEIPYTGEVMFSQLENESWILQYDSGEIMVFQGHTEVRANNSSTEFWVEPGENIVFDFGMIEWGYGERSDYELFVFSNFKSIPFSLVVASAASEIPDSDAIFQDSDIISSAKFSLYSKQPKVLTISIPSDTFKEAGPYDFRVVALPVSLPDDNATIVRKNITFSHAATVNIGEAMDYEPDELKKIDGEVLRTLSWPMDQLLFDTNGLLLGPPSIAEVLENQNELANIKLGKRFVVEGAQLDLSAYISGGSDYGDAGPIYIVILRDSVIVEESGGWIPAPAMPLNTDDMQNDTVFNYTIKIPIAVPIEDPAYHAIRVLKFPYPYCRNPEGGSRNSHSSTGVSNTIFLQ